jgi:hypothetical protein
MLADIVLRSGISVCCRNSHAHRILSRHTTCVHIQLTLLLLLLLVLLQYVPESAKMVCARLLVQMPPTQPQEAYDPAAYLPGIW